MALIECAECKKDMSSEAIACPHCGMPNARAGNRKQDSTQAVGCLIVLLGFPAFLFGPLIGGAVVVIGIAIILTNTRLK